MENNILSNDDDDDGLPRWDVTDGGLDIIGDPLDEVAAVLVLDVQHLLVHLNTKGRWDGEKWRMLKLGVFGLVSFHLFHGHAPAEDSSNGEVTPMSAIADVGDLCLHLSVSVYVDIHIQRSQFTSNECSMFNTLGRRQPSCSWRQTSAGSAPGRWGPWRLIKNWKSSWRFRDEKSIKRCFGSWTLILAQTKFFGMFVAWNVLPNYHLLFKFCPIVLFVRWNHSEEAWKSSVSVAPTVTCWVTTLVIFGSQRCGGADGGVSVPLDTTSGPIFLQTFVFFSFPNILTSVMWYLYCWEPREVRGAKPGMKKWSLLILLLRYFIDILLWNGNISFLHPHWWKVEITSQISGLVSPGEGNHVDGELPQVGVQLAGEPVKYVVGGT